MTWSLKNKLNDDKKRPSDLLKRLSLFLAFIEYLTVLLRGLKEFSKIMSLKYLTYFKYVCVVSILNYLFSRTQTDLQWVKTYVVYVRRILVIGKSSHSLLRIMESWLRSMFECPSKEQSAQYVNTMGLNFIGTVLKNNPPPTGRFVPFRDIRINLLTNFPELEY